MVIFKKLAAARNPLSMPSASMLGPDPRSSYAHLLPWEAAAMSHNGAARGYDLMRWGPDFERGDEESVVARATATHFECLALTAVERNFLYARRRDARDRGDAAWRRQVVENLNKLPWDKLDEQQRNFALSLMWIPEFPRSPLEMLAMQLDGE